MLVEPVKLNRFSLLLEEPPRRFEQFLVDSEQEARAEKPFTQVYQLSEVLGLDQHHRNYLVKDESVVSEVPYFPPSMCLTT